MNTQDFREQDIAVAERESKCINTCLEATKQLIESGDYEMAVKRAEEVLKSAKELDRLAIIKQQSDFTNQVVENFKNKGINVTKLVFS